MIVEMIPKRIHYCWFGRGEKPKIALKCIASWRKFFPGFEIKEWNEDNFDVNAIQYTREAYAAKKYAFVSDYARFAILYKEGGVYFDTDVEVIRPMDDIIDAGPFMGAERDYSPSDNCSMSVAAGLGLAIEPGHGFYRDVLKMYSALHFIDERGDPNKTTVVERVTDLMKKNGFQQGPGIIEFQGIRIYPKEYFNPKSQQDAKIYLTENSRTIHHFAASWFTRRERALAWAKQHLGRRGFLIAYFLLRNPVEYPGLLLEKLSRSLKV